MENERIKIIKIGVLGLGLIGGSILKGLSGVRTLQGGKKYHLTAVSKSSYCEASEFAEVSGDDISLLQGCDLIFICSKMSETNEKLKLLNNILDKKTIVADVSSIKNFLNTNCNFEFIQTHPMAGTEFSSFKNSFKELFVGAKWLIEKENSLLTGVIKDLGAKPVLINMDEHDVYTAEISHLPMILAFSLFDSASNNAKKIAASGFRDMTRLALTHADLAYDMLKFNKKNIEKAYKNFEKSYNKIVNMNEEEFKNFVCKIRENRAKMYDKDGKNILC